MLSFRSDRSQRFSLLLALAALVTGCFDPPVSNELVFVFDAQAGVEVNLTIDLMSPDDASSALLERLDEKREGLLEGWNEWRQRFTRVSPVDAETWAFTRKNGSLVRYEHSLELADATRVEELLADTGVAIQFTGSGRRGEIAIYPGSASRATQDQRETVEEKLVDWSDGAYDYLLTVGALYDYLETAPQRAGPVFTRLFDELVAPSSTVRVSRLERDLVGAATDAIGELLAIFEVAPGEAHTFNELADLVFNPFPAQIGVEVPGRPTEIEGFVAGDERLEIPLLGLWEAFDSLEGVWVSPDPALEWVRTMRAQNDLESEEEVEIDIESFTAAPRSVVLPGGPAEVLAGLELRLEPLEIYRVVYRN